MERRPARSIPPAGSETRWNQSRLRSPTGGRLVEHATPEGAEVVDELQHGADPDPQPMERGGRRPERPQRRVGSRALSISIDRQSEYACASSLSHSVTAPPEGEHLRRLRAPLGKPVAPPAPSDLSWSGFAGRISNERAPRRALLQIRARPAWLGIKSGPAPGSRRTGGAGGTAPASRAGECARGSD